MKKIVLILDGMADRGQDVLNGKTPLEYANTPNLDKLCAMSQMGTVQTIPEGEEAGSAVANLNMLGYTSSEIYKGRAVIEAAGANLPVRNDRLYIRTNFVTFKGDSFEESVIESYSAHDIETDNARPLTKRLNEQLFKNQGELINTDTFRNILILPGKTDDFEELNFMPPHDIIGQPIKNFLNGNSTERKYLDMLKKAYDILQSENDTKANGIWFWGASIAPDTASVKSDMKKIILSETTLMRGISKLLDIECVSILERTSFESFLADKLNVAKNALDSDNEFIYLHIQEPDDLSHELMPEKKAEALAAIDEIFISGLIEKLDSMEEDFTLVVASDHYTFSDTGGHGRQPAPFILYKKGLDKNSSVNFSEANCISANNVLTPKALLGKL